MQTPEAVQLAEVHSHATLTAPAQIDNSESSSATEQSCRWMVRDLEGGTKICGARITHCRDVPKHFRVHGIKKMHDKKMIDCLWSGCNEQVGRKNFVRHIRECHLNRRRYPSRN